MKGGEKVGEEPNHTTARKPGPLSILQYPLNVMNLLHMLSLLLRKCGPFKIF
jgi:hypothetical protein